MRTVRLIALFTALAATGFGQAIQQVMIAQTVTGSSSSTGPGDVVTSGWLAWWGLQAFSAATVGNKAANICNAALTCADAVSKSDGTLDLSNVTGAPLNCGGSGGQCTGKKLYDQTGNLNCGGAACDLDILNHTFNLVLNCLGSLPCLQATDASTSLTSTNTITFAQPNSFVFVGKRVTTGSSLINIYCMGGGTQQLGYGNAANSAWFYAGSVVSVTGATDAAFHVVQGLFNSGSSKLDVDGTVTASLNPGVGAPTNLAFVLGQCGNGGVFQWGSGGWLSGDKSPSFSALNTFLHGFWGF